MSKKREVRDARFRDREPAEPRSPAPERPKPALRPPPAPRGMVPRTARPVAPSKASEDVDRDDDPPADPESGPLPPWLSPNLIVPALIAVLLGVALYEKFGAILRPTPAPVAAADGGTGSPDGGPADAAAAAVADAAAAAAPARPGPNDGSPVAPRTPTPSSPDPLAGNFSLAQATAGLTGTGDLHADIETSLGTFDCTLLDAAAPRNVANFVGLARGLRDFWDPVAAAWVKRPFYDGSIFHRVIPDFMIQGGDQLRSGSGDTGYELPDENVRPHDAAGLLCMANKGPNTASAQFFITEVAKPHLDGSYSILGRCAPTDLVNRIARVPRGADDRPDAPVHILSVRVRRAP